MKRNTIIKNCRSVSSYVGNPDFDLSAYYDTLFDESADCLVELFYNVLLANSFPKFGAAIIVLDEESEFQELKNFLTLKGIDYKNFRNIEVGKQTGGKTIEDSILFKYGQYDIYAKHLKTTVNKSIFLNIKKALTGK